jgi:coenzyme F420-reducing hydrogenase delta subunit
MTQQLVHPDIVVYLCSNCIPSAAGLPRQWSQDASQVLVREVPCSGKMDGQYLLHGLEGGAAGVCVVACPKGECHLAQGNYRAEIRLRTLQRLLAEIGLQPERVELVHCSTTDPPDQFESRVRQAVGRIARLGESPLRSGAK